MSTPGKLRGNYAKTAGRRREILLAGIDVFSSSGYRNGSIREIAEKVGMSQAGLLHHFSSKSELLAGVLELRDEISKEQFDFSTTTGVESIRGLIELVEYNQTVPGIVQLHCVLSAEATSPEHPAHDYFVERYDRVVSASTESFVFMAEHGGLRSDVEPRHLARDMMALVDGLQVQWLLQNRSFDMAKELRAYLQPLLTVEL